MDPILVVGLIVILVSGIVMVSPRGAKGTAEWTKENQNPLAPGTRPQSTKGVRIMGMLMILFAVVGGAILIGTGQM